MAPTLREKYQRNKEISILIMPVEFQQHTIISKKNYDDACNRFITGNPITVMISELETVQANVSIF